MELERARSLKEEGVAVYQRGQYEAASSCFREAEALFAAAGDRRGQAEMLNNLGVIYLQDGRWGEAEEAFQKAKGIFESLDDMAAGRAQSLGNLGELYRRLGKREEAVKALKEAAGLFNGVGEKEKEGKSLQMISRIRLEDGRWLETLHFYELSLACRGGAKSKIIGALVRLPLNLLSRGRPI